MLPDGLLAGAIIMLVALLTDRWLGEPEKFHPLVGFGWLANKTESACRRLPVSEKVQGVIAWSVAVLPIVFITLILLESVKSYSVTVWFVLNIAILYLTIGGKSLIQHAENIYVPLKAGDMENARYQVSMIVSRNTEKMGEKEITSSAIESVLENGNDAVFAPMLWFVLLGAPGAVLLRLVNTLDAMWGYKNDKYLNFGCFAARTDDFLGWLPARITAVVYAFQGNFTNAVRCWREQAKACSSPNGGVVMTTGAGALDITIGGPTYYHGVLHDKKPMGSGDCAGWQSIPKANQLVTRGSLALSVLWLVCVIAGVS